MPLFAQIAIRAEVSEDEAVDIAKNLFAGEMSIFILVIIHQQIG